MPSRALGAAAVVVAAASGGSWPLWGYRLEVLGLLRVVDGSLGGPKGATVLKRFKGFWAGQYSASQTVPKRTNSSITLPAGALGGPASVAGAPCCMHFAAPAPQHPGASQNHNPRV